MILAHGSRDSAACQRIIDMVENIGQKVWPKQVVPAFFSMGKPALEQAVEDLIRRGCCRVIIFPFFLVDGSHVLKDIPARIRALQQKYSEVEFEILDSLEHEPLITRILEEKALFYL